MKSLPVIGSPLRKIPPGGQFTGKNPPRAAVARAEQIFTGKLSAGGDFSGESDPIMGHRQHVSLSSRRRFVVYTSRGVQTRSHITHCRAKHAEKTHSGLQLPARTWGQ